MSRNIERSSLEWLKTQAASENITPEQREQMRENLVKLPLTQQIEFWNHVETLNSQAKNDLLQLKQEMWMTMEIQNSEIMNVLREWEMIRSMWARIEWNRIILPAGAEIRDKIKKLETVINFINYLTEYPNPITEAYKQWKIENYKQLIHPSSSWLLDWKYLQYKYMYSIFGDLKEENKVVEKQQNWTYKVYTLKDGKKEEVQKEDCAYTEFLLDSRYVKSFNMDFAIVFQVAQDWGFLDRERAGNNIKQSTLVKHLLDKHQITDPRSDGNETLEVRLLRLDWDKIKTQIDEKLETSKGWSIEHYQELMFLKSYIENKEYVSVDHNRDLFTEINEFRNFYLVEKAMYDLVRSNNWKDITPETYGEVLWNVIKENSLPMWALGILLLLFKDTRKWWLGVLWGLIWLPIVWNIMSRTEKAIKWSEILWFSDDDLWLLNPRNIELPTFWINDDYLSSYNKVLSKNKDVSKSNQVDTSFYNNRTINYIFEQLTKIDVSTLNKQELKSWDINPVATAIFDEIKKNGWVEYNILWVWNKELTQENIKIFLWLLLSTKETADETLLDALVDGRHILNRAYKENKVIDQVDFNTEVHSILKAAFDGSDDVEKKKRVEKLSSDLARANTTLQNALSKINSIVSNNIPFTDVNNVLNELERVDEKLANSLRPVFASYEKYINAEAKIKPFEWIIDENIDDFKSKLWWIFGIVWTTTSRENLTRLYWRVDWKITELNSLKISDPALLAKPAFTNINKRIDKIIEKLEQSKININEQHKTLFVNYIPESIQINNWWENNPNILFGLIENNYNNFKSISPRITTIESLWNNIENIVANINSLDNYYKEIITGRLALNSTNNSLTIRAQESIIALLTEYNDTKKVELQDKIKDVINAHYDSIEAQRTSVDSVDLSRFNPSQLNTYFSTLLPVAKFLEKAEPYTRNVDILSLNFQVQFWDSLNTKDSQASEVIRKSSDLWITDLPDWTNNYEALKTAYEAKVSELEVKVGEYLDETITEANRITNLDQISAIVNKYKNIESAFLGNQEITLKINEIKDILKNKIWELTLITTQLNEITNIQNQINPPLSPEITNAINVSIWKGWMNINKFIDDIEGQLILLTPPQDLPEAFKTKFNDLKNTIINTYNL